MFLETRERFLLRLVETGGGGAELKQNFQQTGTCGRFEILLQFKHFFLRGAGNCYYYYYICSLDKRMKKVLNYFWVLILDV